MKTYKYPNVTLTSYTGGEEASNVALSPFGPVSQGLTTLQRMAEAAQLLELLSSLEKQVETLTNKSSRVLDMSLIASTHLVEPYPSTNDIIGTDK